MLPPPPKLKGSPGIIGGINSLGISLGAGLGSSIILYLGSYLGSSIILLLGVTVLVVVISKLELAPTRESVLVVAPSLETMRVEPPVLANDSSVDAPRENAIPLAIASPLDNPEDNVDAFDTPIDLAIDSDSALDSERGNDTAREPENSLLKDIPEGVVLEPDISVGIAPKFVIPWDLECEPAAAIAREPKTVSVPAKTLES